MIFLTVGSRSFQFDRLLKAVDCAIANGEIEDEIFAQIGASTYSVQNYNTVPFLNQEEFNKKMSECDIIVTHGGTGVIVNAVKMGKRVVAIPRLEQYHEAVDNHQVQLVKAFEELEMVTGCYDCNQIGKAISAAKVKVFKPFVSNTQTIIDSIDEMIMSEQSGLMSKKDGKIRILMCSSDRREKGGMNSVIDQLMDHDWGDGYEFSYLATHITGNPIKKILFFIKAYIKLKQLIRKNKFDIIHIHMSYKGSFYRKYYVSKVCKKHNKKVIIHLHGSEFKNFYKKGDEKRKKQIKELFSSVDTTIVLGKDWEQFISQIAPDANITIINNAISLPAFEKKVSNNQRIFLFLGALIKRKGVIDLLTAAKNMREKGFINFKILIAGSGEEENFLKEFVKKNQMMGCIKFLGWITNDQKPDLFRNADVLVLPSYNEGLPVAILEAMSYGLPIISTNVGSIAEAVCENENGFLFNPGDVDSLERALITMSTNNEFWKAASLMSRKICEANFSDVIFFDKIKDIYHELR